MQNEIILNVFPGANAENRLVLVRAMTICGLEHLLLRQETHSADVGWFVQNQVAIEPGQVAALKMTLSPTATRRKSPTVGAGASNAANAARGASRPRSASASPVILQFEAAG